MEVLRKGVTDWIERIDPTSKKKYWGNLVTKETTWNEPDVVSRWRSGSKDGSYIEVIDTKTKLPYYVDEKSKATTWIKPLGKIRSSRELVGSGGGTTSKSEALPRTTLPQVEQKTASCELKDGQVEVSKEKQQDANTWVECLDTSRNRCYYFNPKTKVTTWNKPRDGNIMSAEAYRAKHSSKQSKSEERISIKKGEEDHSADAQVGPKNTRHAAKEHKLAHHDEESATAVMNSDGTISGWAAKRTMDEDTFVQQYLLLKSNVLECRTSESMNEAPADFFSLKDLVFATICDDECGSDYMFVIQIAGNACTWFLGIDSIEDMQLWLEALQVQVRRNRVASVESRASSASVSSDPGQQRGGAVRRHGHLSRRRTSSLSMSSTRHLSTFRTAASSQSEFDAPAPVPETFHSWAELNDFTHLIPSFAKAGFDDLLLIAQLQDDELKEMLEEHVQVENPGQRMKIVVAVRNLRKSLNSA